jgi:hypothetical protein
MKRSGRGEQVNENVWCNPLTVSIVTARRYVTRRGHKLGRADAGDAVTSLSRWSAWSVSPSRFLRSVYLQEGVTYLEVEEKVGLHPYKRNRAQVQRFKSSSFLLRSAGLKRGAAWFRRSRMEQPQISTRTRFHSVAKEPVSSRSTTLRSGWVFQHFQWSD